MAFDQSLDLDFQFLDHQDFLLDNVNEEGGNNNNNPGVDVDALFEPETTNPVFGNDISLASTLNFNSADDDFLACAPTDVYPFGGFPQSQVPQLKDVALNRSPSHESDSGMSDTTPSSSPQRSFQGGETIVVSAPPPMLQDVDVLNVNVEDIDFDIDQYSPTSSYTASPPHSNVSIADDLITETDVRQKKALEFFDSTDMFSVSDTDTSRVRLVKVQQDVSEDKSKKNAIQAKLNREKKKAYIKSLEEEITALRSDNAKLKSDNKKMQRNTADLEEEVDYLKSVLVNSSALSGLLKNISNVKEVKLSATVLGKRKAMTEDHSYNFVESVPEKRARRINENLKKAGVCLHVNGGSACLEFCAHCSKLAQKSSVS